MLLPPKSLLDIPPDQMDPATRAAVAGFRSALEMQGIDGTHLFDMAPCSVFSNGHGAMIAERIRDAGIPVTLGAAAFAAWASDRPAKAVLWAYTLKCLYDHLRRTVTLDDIAAAFPGGIPSDAGAKAIWDAQKTPNGNLLDTPGPWRAAVLH